MKIQTKSFVSCWFFFFYRDEWWTDKVMCRSVTINRESCTPRRTQDIFYLGCNTGTDHQVKPQTRLHASYPGCNKQWDSNVCNEQLYFYAATAKSAVWPLEAVYIKLQTIFSPSFPPYVLIEKVFVLTSIIFFCFVLFWVYLLCCYYYYDSYVSY